MLKKIFFVIALQGSAMLFAQEGILKIEVTDKVSEAPLELANVLLESAGVVAATGVTDEKGNLTIKNLAPGEYNVKTAYTGYPKKMITGVLIKNNQTTYLSIQLASENYIDEFVFEDYHIEKYDIPLINPDTEIKKIFDHDAIMKSPITNMNDLLLTAGGVQIGEGTTPYFRAARPEGVVYMIDGMRVIGTYGIPKGAIEQMSVTLGGIPAKYGDGTAAFIEIETRSGLVNSNK